MAKYTSSGSEHYNGAEYMHGALLWDQTNEHYYETGVSQAVIYLKERTAADDFAQGTASLTWKPSASATLSGSVTVYPTTQYWGGVAWNGLISCTQTPDGADTEDLYANNDKYLSLRAKEDFGGSLSAYTYPDVWAICDGTARATFTQGSGATAFSGAIRIHGQTRKAFGLSYITNEGNDTAFQDFSQKLHIIYEATASPTDREYSTINDSPEAIEMSWDFKTTPVSMAGITGANLTKSSYIEILKSEVKEDNWNALLAALHGWGTATSESVLMTNYCPAWLPDPGQIYTIVTSTIT